jgi:signal peptidase II
LRTCVWAVPHARGGRPGKLPGTAARICDNNMKYAKYYLLCLLVVVLDHALKLGVHFNMALHQDIPVLGDWFRLHYLLNKGMAFGMEFTFLSDEVRKVALSVFRVLATAGIGYYLLSQARKGAHQGFLVCLALILGGAVGNAIDSIFYGVLLEGNAIEGASTPWFHGRVIDMLYFPLIDGRFPEWLPVWGGQYFSFFNAIFNIADSAIFLGAAGIMVFQRRFFAHEMAASAPTAAAETHEATAPEEAGTDDRTETYEEPARPGEGAAGQAPGA